MKKERFLWRVTYSSKEGWTGLRHFFIEADIKSFAKDQFVEVVEKERVDIRSLGYKELVDLLNLLYEEIGNMEEIVETTGLGQYRLDKLRAIGAYIYRRTDEEQFRKVNRSPE